MNPTPEIQSEIEKCSQGLREYITGIVEEIAHLTVKNLVLHSQINQNSSNSSKPSSTNQYSKPKSLRVITGRKPGGQPGHKGTTLKKSDKPDVTIVLEPEICENCGADLSDIESTLAETKQVIECKIIKMIIQYLAMSKICDICKHETVAKFPEGVNHYIQYGKTYRSLMVCLNKGNFVPYSRLAKFSKDAFGIDVSPGTLVNIVNECAYNMKK